MTTTAPVTTTATPVVVHLLDDDAAVRRALARLLTECGHEVHTYPSGPVLLRELTARPIGCLLLDLRMPGMSGLEVQAALEQQGCIHPIIYLTAHGDVPTSVLAMKRGAVDFLEKPVQEKELLAALEHAARLLDERTREQSASQHVKARLATLTKREREVIALVVGGLRNREIATRLSVCLQTVKIHRMHGMTKLGVQTVPHLMRAWAQATNGG